MRTVRAEEKKHKNTSTMLQTMTNEEREEQKTNRKMKEASETQKTEQKEDKQTNDRGTQTKHDKQIYTDPSLNTLMLKKKETTIETTRSQIKKIQYEMNEAQHGRKQQLDYDLQKKPKNNKRTRNFET